jgi:hypothetical protein
MKKDVASTIDDALPVLQIDLYFCTTMDLQYYGIDVGRATFLPDRLRYFGVAPSSVGGYLSFEQRLQSTEDGGACHFGPQSSIITHLHGHSEMYT